MYTFSLVSVPLFHYLVSRHHYTTVPSFIRKIFPGILWPNYWPLERDSLDNLLTGQQSSSRQSLLLNSNNSTTNNTATNTNTTTLPFHNLYNFEEIFAQLSRDVVVSLTFGLCCPPLAVLILFVIWIKYFCSKIILNRFFFSRMRLVTTAEHTEQSALFSPRNSLVGHRDTSASVISSTQTSFSETSMSMSLTTLSDPLVQILNSSFNSVEMAFERCFPPILFSTTIFFGLLCWDISADEISWKKTIYIPVTMIATCLFLFAVLYHYHIGLIAECRVRCEKWNETKGKNGEKRMTTGSGEFVGEMRQSEITITNV
jgi:hypothetical protein